MAIKKKRTKVRRDILRRYTDVTSLLHILRNKRITLLNPETWDDKNDSKFIEIYKEKEDVKHVLALCFTHTSETYHHWKVFSSGNTGVCIKFHKHKLIKYLNKKPSLQHRRVTYKTLSEIQRETIKTSDLPFLKRHPFRDEKEYRIVYKSNSNAHKNFINIGIGLDCIESIVINPWINKNLANSLKETVREIDQCKEIRIIQTSINENNTWLQCGQKSV